MGFNGIIVEVSDTYYGDHDSVLVSIPITGEAELTNVSTGESNNNNKRSNNELVVNSSTSSFRPRSFTVPNLTRGKRQLCNTTGDCSSNKKSQTNDGIEIIEKLSHFVRYSHPNFHYYQVDEEWQRQWCSMFGLECNKIYDRSNGSSNTSLTAPTARCVQHILGDGNCSSFVCQFVICIDWFTTVPYECAFTNLRAYA